MSDRFAAHLLPAMRNLPARTRRLTIGAAAAVTIGAAVAIPALLVTSLSETPGRLRDAGGANVPQTPRKRRGSYFRDAPDVTTAHPEGRQP